MKWELKRCCDEEKQAEQVTLYRAEELVWGDVVDDVGTMAKDCSGEHTTH